MNETPDSDVITIKIPTFSNFDSGKVLRNVRQNPWIVSTFILGIFIFVLLTNSLFAEPNGAISSNNAAEKLVTFLNENSQSEITFESVSSDGSLYQVNVSYQGSSIPLYITNDGKYFVQGVVPLSSLIGVENTLNENSAGSRSVPGVDDDAVLGNENAKVTIIEFSDYQCPFCRKFWTETLPQLKTNYIDTGKVKLVYRDMPLTSIHPIAQASAEAAECVREKGGDSAYYKMHDKMFEEQNIIDSGNPNGPVKGTVSYTKDDLKAWASEIGYDINSCLDSGKYKSEVQKDSADAQAAGGQGTPYFFVNGQEVSGAQPFSVFKEIIDRELS
ncbi:MAG: DsbA family protein [Nanoarchaeota archaeon]